MNEIYGKAPLNNSAKWGRGGALAIGTMTSQSTPQPITGPLLARAPGLQPRLAQWLMRPCISVWYSNATNQDCKALQRVVRLAERISGSALPSLQDIYLKRCKGRAVKIIKDSNHPGNRLFISLPSGKRFRSVLAKTERLRRSFYPQAIRLLNSVSYHL